MLYGCKVERPGIFHGVHRSDAGCLEKEQREEAQRSKWSVCVDINKGKASYEGENASRLVYLGQVP